MENLAPDELIKEFLDEPNSFSIHKLNNRKSLLISAFLRIIFSAIKYKRDASLKKKLT